MAGAIRKSSVRQVPLSELKDDLSRFLREAEKHDWFDHRLENDPRFLQRIERARQNLRAGRSVKIEDVKETP